MQTITPRFSGGEEKRNGVEKTQMNPAEPTDKVVLDCGR